jgi:hypothetical protein
MKVRIYEDLKSLPPGYSRLFDGCGSHRFCYSLPWFENLIDNGLPKEERVRIYGVELEDPTQTPIAALPTRFRPSNGILGPRRLLGLSNFYTTLFGPLFNSSCPDISETMTELALAICRDGLRWDVVDLSPVDRDSSTYLALAAAFRTAGMVVQTYFCFGNWYLLTGGRSYKEYLDTLPSALRNTIRRKARILESRGRVRFELLTGCEGLESAIQAYERIYLASWKSPEPFPLFVPGLIRMCAERGWLRLGLAYIDGEPAAAQVWIVQGDLAFIYKLAYDERFSRFSIGTLLTARMMEHVLDADFVREVDYLTGDDSYKKAWMSHRRERWGILALNPRTLHGCAQIMHHLGGRAVRTVLQKWSRRDEKISGKSEPASHTAQADRIHRTTAPTRDACRSGHCDPK